VFRTSDQDAGGARRKRKNPTGREGPKSLGKRPFQAENHDGSGIKIYPYTCHTYTLLPHCLSKSPISASVTALSSYTLLDTANLYISAAFSMHGSLDVAKCTLPTIFYTFLVSHRSTVIFKAFRRRNPVAFDKFITFIRLPSHTCNVYIAAYSL
jgi:hypothetical protein